MRALNVTELDYVSGGEGDNNANDNAGGNDAPPRNGSSGPVTPSSPVYPPFIPTQPWVGEDGNTNHPP